MEDTVSLTRSEFYEQARQACWRSCAIGAAFPLCIWTATFLGLSAEAILLAGSALGLVAVNTQNKQMLENMDIRTPSMHEGSLKTAAQDMLACCGANGFSMANAAIFARDAIDVAVNHCGNWHAAASFVLAVTFTLVSEDRVRELGEHVKILRDHPLKL